MDYQDKNNFLKKYKISERKVCTIPNWFVSNTRENKEYNIQSKKIISVGRLEKVKGYNYLIDGLTIHNEDIFIYLTIKTDEEDYIVEITEKYLFSASLINEAIKNTKGEKAYYRHLETGGQIYE